MSKILLVVHALMSIVYAVLVARDPGAMAGYMGLAIAVGDGSAEILAMYVGMSTAVSVFMLYAVYDTRLLQQAVLFLAVFISGVALGRTLGLVWFETGSYTLGALVYDIPMTFLAWFAFLRNRGEQGFAGRGER